MKTPVISSFSVLLACLLGISTMATIPSSVPEPTADTGPIIVLVLVVVLVIELLSSWSKASSRRPGRASQFRDLPLTIS